MRLEGKTAIVTGGASGFGAGIVRKFVAEGARVMIADINGEAAGAFAAEVGPQALVRQVDVSKAESVNAMAEAALEAFGQIDILVNNAGVSHMPAPLDEISEADFDRVLAVNLTAPFFLSQAAAPLLATGAGGTIINILDLSAVQAWPSYAPHAVSKAGLAHLTRILARVLAPHVRVNAIAPGSVLPPTDDDGQDLALGPARQVLERAGQPDDAVSALLWLASADFVTGQVIAVDGGRLLL